MDGKEEGELGRPYDVVIYGATGYTGQLCVQQMDMLLSQPENVGRSFAIAGRDHNRLERISNQCSTQPHVYPVQGLEDMDGMCSSACVVLSCAGPYVGCGEDVVASCVRHSTHYIDVSFEQVWMHDMIEKYHQAAKEKGVMLVFSAGHQSSPFEIMAYKLVQALGPIKDITMYDFQYGFGTGGTARSRALAFEQMRDMRAFEITNDPFNLGGKRRCGVRPEDKDCAVAEQDSHFPSLWLFPVVRTACSRIIRRTCELFDETPSDNVQYGDEFLIRIRDAAPGQKAAQAGLDQAQGKPCLVYEELENLIEKTWKGIEIGAPPAGLGNTPEMRALHYEHVYAVAEAESGEQAYVYLDGPDAMEMSAICSTAGVLTLLEELDKMKPEERGGCVTPAYAFHNTSWIDRVEEHAMSKTRNRKLQFTLKEGIPDFNDVKKAMTGRSSNAMKGQALLSIRKISLWGHPPLADKEIPSDDEEEEEEEEEEEPSKPLAVTPMPEETPVKPRVQRKKLPPRRWIVCVSSPVLESTAGGPAVANKLPDLIEIDAELEEVDYIGNYLRFKKLSGDGPEAGWAKTEKDFQALIVPKTAGLHSVDRPLTNPNCPRVLVLHGIASGEAIVNMQLSRLFERSRGMVDFFVLEGSKQCSDKVASERMQAIFPGKNIRMYAPVCLDNRGWRCFEKVRDALKELQHLVTAHGPFDAVLGFSQGAAFAVMLAAQAAHGVGASFPSVICLSPQAPGYVSQVPELFTESLPNRALIIRGAQEKYNKGQEFVFEDCNFANLGENVMSDHVVKLFHKAHTYTHPDDHLPMPKDMEEKDKVVERIIDFVHRRPLSPQVLPDTSVSQETPKPKEEKSTSKEEEQAEAAEVEIAPGERKKLLKEFRKAPLPQRSDAEKVLDIVKKCGIALEYASSSLQADPTIVAAAVKQDGYALEYASPELRADFDIVQAAVQQDGWALEFSADSLKDNREIVLEAIGSTWKALRFASQRLRRQDEIMAVALEQSQDAEQYRA
mmetsp:Transcript_35127/g.65046  ORF Transcript_35127/g.65046 Transcript_35127/m.65046 type:complete len:1007 (-) Transcript_35127:245-3265(-)